VDNAVASGDFHAAAAVAAVTAGDASVMQRG